MPVQPAVSHVRRVRESFAADDVAGAASIVVGLTPREIADLLVLLGPAELARLEPYLGVERIADAVAVEPPARKAEQEVTP